MSECEFNHEDFCILQVEHPNAPHCRFAKGELQECTAEESDLIELCSDCDKPVSECDCGTNWIIVEDREGNHALVTPRKYKLLKEKEEGEALKKKEPEL